MTTELENHDSLNVETLVEEFKNLDEDARVEKFQEFVTKHNEKLDTNRQLYARAKKAEGFELKDGKWIKVEPKVELKPEAKETGKSDDALLQKLETLTLRTAQISEEDEVELVNKWKKETGRDIDVVLGSKIFQAELNDLRTAKANARATSNLSSSTGTSQKDPGSLAKKMLTGEFDDSTVSKDELADIALKAASMSKSGGKTFYND